MKVLLFFVCSLFIIPTGKCASVQSIELIYDKAEVYNGNEITFEIKTTTRKGKEYLSSTEDSKFNCDVFIFRISKGVKVTKTKTDFSLTIPIDYAKDSLKIDIAYYYRSNFNYTFYLPIVDYKKKIQSIHITPVKIQRSDIVQLNVEARIKNRLSIQSVDNEEIRTSDFRYKVLAGGELINETGEIRILDTAACDPQLSVAVTLTANPSITTIFNQPISPSPIIKCDFSGTNGVKPTNPTKGANGEDSKLLIGMKGGNGDPGKNGNTGTDGKNGTNLQVYLKLILSPCSTDTVIEVVIKNQEGKLLEKLLCDTKNQTININSNGGNGGNGADGSDGGNGGNGRYYIDPTNSTVHGGGNGGDAGNGGNGGDGGDGGNITLFYTAELNPYLWHIVLNANAGYGGRGGNAGLGGVGGDPGNGDTGTALRGNNGRNGLQGRDGRTGRNGIINRVVSN